MTDAGYEERIRAAWARRDEGLRNPYGWLSLAGLWWLHPGENGFGADASNEIVISGQGVPARAGVLRMTDASVRLEPADPAVLLARAPARAMDLADDLDGEPTVLEVGSLQAHLVRRGDRIGLRVRDPGAPALVAFSGVDHFPIDPSWRVAGRFSASPGEEIEIVDVTGYVGRDPLPGHFSFERDGRTWRLAVVERFDDGSLWLIFGDATNGRGTYGGGRYLITEPVDEDGGVVADFNLAYNPPCVFSPYATCPLPPGQNRLPLAIEAGERVEH